jgi:hypothetical protein
MNKENHFVWDNQLVHDGTDATCHDTWSDMRKW